MRVRLAALALALALTLAAPAGAQDPEFFFPNPLRGGGVAATCEGWEAQRAAADPEAMRQLVGLWEAQSILPGMPGVTADAPRVIRTMFGADGTFQQQDTACQQPYAAPGMPAFEPVCGSMQIYGEWTAHRQADGSLVVATLSSGTSRTGQALPISCAAGVLRVLDPNTLVDGTGGMSRRLG